MAGAWNVWISMVREGMLVYAGVILALTGLFLSKGELPARFALMCRWAGVVWLMANAWLLSDVGGFHSKHMIILGVIPAIYALVLPELVMTTMMFLYLFFGWPEPLRRQYLAEERARLDQAVRDGLWSQSKDSVNPPEIVLD